MSASVATATGPHTRLRASARRLVISMTALVVVDAVGGVVAVATDVNTWSEAWGPKALLAAPLPMVAGQVLMTALTTRTSRRWGALPAGALSAACLVSIVSGFFDGGLGHEALTPWHSAYQVLLLAVTGLVGGLAAARVRALLTHREA